MCQLAVEIPEQVLYDTHMTETQSEVLARKIIAITPRALVPSQNVFFAFDLFTCFSKSEITSKLCSFI